MEIAPDESLFVVESDERFDPTQLPECESWKTRQYSPAMISVFRKWSESAAGLAEGENEQSQADGQSAQENDSQ